MKHTTAALSGAWLDFAVAKSEGLWRHPPSVVLGDKGVFVGLRNDSDTIYSPSTDWSQGGPIIEREGICLQSPDASLFPPEPNPWHAGIPSEERPVAMFDCRGPTALIAAMRAYVASKLGAEVDLP